VSIGGYCPENTQIKTRYELKQSRVGPQSYGFMMKDIVHGGPAPADGSALGPFTIFTWGNGAALATAATIRDLNGVIYVDTTRGAAFALPPNIPTRNEV